MRGTGPWLFDGEEDVIDAPVHPGLADPDDWRVLLALHDDDRIGLKVLDAGAFHVMAPIADLSEGRYDRLVCDVDSS